MAFSDLCWITFLGVQRGLHLFLDFLLLLSFMFLRFLFFYSQFCFKFFFFFYFFSHLLFFSYFFLIFFFFFLLFPYFFLFFSYFFLIFSLFIFLFIERHSSIRSRRGEPFHRIDLTYALGRELFPEMHLRSIVADVSTQEMRPVMD